MTPRGPRAHVPALAAACLTALIELQAQSPAPAQPAETPSPAQSDQVFRGVVDFVRVDAYPRKDGRVVEGLTADDFQVFEDGEPQAIATFEFIRHTADRGYGRVDPRNRAEAERWIADPARRLFVIYVDYYHITLAASHQIREPLMRVLGEAIGPSDLVALVTPEARIEDVAFVQTLNSISSDLLRYWEAGLADMPVQPRTPAENRLAACGNAGSGYREIIQRFRDDVFFTSLESLIAHMGAFRQDRTNVILLSEGWQNRRGGIRIGAVTRNRALLLRQQGVPPTGQGRAGSIDQFGRPTADIPAAREPSCAEQLMRLEVDYEDRFRRLIRQANANNVAFHTIDVGGLRTDGPTAAGPAPADRAFRPNPAVLQELAENTDGIATVNANDVDFGLRRVIDHTASYYLLGYASTNTTRDGEYREIEVRVKQDDVDVTARRGYTAVSDELQRLAAERAVRDAVPAATADVIGALSRWDAGEPLRVQALETGEGVDVIVEIDEREYANGPWRAGGSIDVEIVDGSGVIARAAGTLPAGSRSTALTVAAGAARTGPRRIYVRLIAGDAELTTRAAVDGALPQSARLGAPRYFRISGIGRPTPVPVVAPVFQRPERVRIEWPLQAAPDTPRVQLTDRRGQRLEPGAALAHTVDRDRALFIVDLYTAGLAEGDYAIEVEVRADGGPERQVVAFRVGR